MALRVGQFRWWQCLIVGLLVGVASWQAQRLVEGSHEPKFAVGMSRWRFISFATTKNPPAGAPTMRDLIVHPAIDGKMLVAGIDSSDNGPHPFEFVAATPFDVPAARDGTTPARTFPTVRDFLDQAPAAIAYRYAWWEEPRWITAMWFGGPVMLIGALLPVALAVLRRVGVLPPLPVKEKPLPPSKPEPAKAMPQVDHAAVASQLQAATDDLEQRLASGSSESSPTSATVTATADPQRLFTAGPADAPVPIAEKEATTYEAGVYYPVHRSKREEK